ncbi:hypothetical protein [Rhizobium leguminosarum]|uniref:hypothetical protein n=1 Tax=Rhizobium leguminosarum TaxID=384 RepID=UPI0004B34EEF|nr:hypothetical protein [Rhizobium leguminosarum]
MAIVRQYAGQAVVRVGLTQFPAGVGVKEPTDLKPDLVDACQTFAKARRCSPRSSGLLRKWYGNPQEQRRLPADFRGSGLGMEDR